MKYMYQRNVLNDVLRFIKCNTKDFFALSNEDFFEMMWASDDVTGNGSGSYFCSRWTAEDAVCHNWDLAYEALQEFGYSGNPFEMGAEAIDVCIRCYLLPRCFDDAIKIYMEDHKEEI